MLATAQGVKPVKTLDEIRGGWPESEINDDFGSVVRQWRDDELRRDNELGHQDG